MKIAYHEINRSPVLIVDDFYDNLSYENIWKEICFLNLNIDHFEDADRSGSATDPVSNKILKKNKAIFLDQIYKNPNFSPIWRASRKIFSVEFLKLLENYNYFFRYIKNSNAESILLSYYENSDYYNSHYDSATVTLLTWMYYRPKKFKGGDLTIENNLKIDCISNRTVIFPSFLYHSVSPIELEDQYLNNNYGRYTISHFLSTNLGS